MSVELGVRSCSAHVIPAEVVGEMGSMSGREVGIENVE
jgi:hypothetical protein